MLNSHYMYRHLTQVKRVDLSVHAYSDLFSAYGFRGTCFSRDAIDRALLAFLIDWSSDQHTLVEEVISRLGGLVCLCFLPMPQNNRMRKRVMFFGDFDKV